MRTHLPHSSPQPVPGDSSSARLPAYCLRPRTGLRFILLAALLLCCCATTAAAQAPVLISEPSSTRAVAFSSPTFQREPFEPVCTAAICQGQRTRVMLFVMGLALQPSDAASAVTARAEDGSHRFYDLTVEYVGKAPGYEWMSAVVLKLGDDVGDVGDLLVRVSYRGADSNRVRIAVGHQGGGPADDTGAMPTPAPPFTIGGFVRDGVAGIPGVSVSVGGASGVTLTTGADGSFSLAGLPAGGRHTLSLTKPCYSFDPLPLVVESLYRNTFVSLSGAENRVDGRVIDANGQPVASVSIAATGASAASAQTDASGNFFFNCLTPGDYVITPAHARYDFTPVSLAVGALNGGRRADFNAALKRHTIRGRVLDPAGAGLAGVAVTLSGSRNAATATDKDGNYSFPGLQNGGNYTVAAVKNQYDISPASRVFADLSADQTADFSSALSRYVIGGRVATLEGAGVGGATLTLSGGDAPPRTAVSGADGGYSFSNVIAKGNYTITASRVNYDLSPAAHSYVDLGANQTANFDGVAHLFRIHGRVTSAGQPVGFVHVELTGARAAKTIADAGGNYFFDVPAESDYTVAPSTRHFYDYTPPARSFVALAAHTVADFAASPVAPPAVQQSLEWDGSPKTVDYDYFFNTPGDMGHFFWEFWAMPGATSGSPHYILSDGYGGAHALLFGFNNLGLTEPGRYMLVGNIWNGSGLVQFFSDEGPTIGEWGHFAVGWDGKEIVTYFNGVPVGRTPFTGPRREAGFNNGGGRLLIGGSDHNNLIGRIAQVRGFEGVNPREALSDTNVSGVRAAFAPETVFRTGGQLLSNYFTPLQTVPDISAGLASILHGGRLRGTPHPYGLLVFCEECPRPQYVVDPTAPDFATATDRSQRTFNPSSAPGGALAYDSFSRRNATHALGAGGLGQTESGSAGQLAWQHAPALPQGAAFGILNERAVVLANRRALAWVVLPPVSLSTGHDLRVRRRTGTRSAGFDTGLAFRVADADNYFFAYTTGGDFAPNARTLTVGYYLNGQRTELATGLPMTSSWAELRVVTTPSGAIRVYANSSLIYSTKHGLFADATGAGLYNNGPGLGLANRWDDFVAYEATAP